MQNARLLWLTLAVFLLLSGVIGYFLLTQPAACSSEGSLANLRAVEWGTRTEGGASVVGVQPFMEPTHYACEAAFHARLAAYMDSIQARGWLTPRTIVVFPEYIGTWLVLAGEPAAGLSAKTLNGALTWFVLRRPWAFWQAYRQAKQDSVADPAALAVFRLKAQEMAEMFHRTFSSLAARYGVTIVAGSIVLPGAQIRGDSLTVDPTAPVHNVSIVYDPQGRPHARIIRKAFPIATELAFTQPGRAVDLPVFETPLGRLGVLICADSWFPESYAALGKVEVIAVPSYLMGDSCWAAPWRGYSGWATPADVRPDSLREGEAWLRYAMGGRLPRWDSTAVGLNVFLQGRFWELGADGRAIAVYKGRTFSAEADIVCLWLP